MVSQAAEIKLRAERKAGEMLKAGDKNTGQLRRGCAVQPRDDAPSYADLGIEKTQAMRWQLEAEIPAEQAKARQLATLKQYQGTVTQTSAERNGNGKGETRDAVAAVAGVSHDTIAKVKVIEAGVTSEMTTVARIAHNLAEADGEHDLRGNHATTVTTITNPREYSRMLLNETIQEVRYGRIYLGSWAGLRRRRHWRGGTGAGRIRHQCAANGTAAGTAAGRAA